MNQEMTELDRKRHARMSKNSLLNTEEAASQLWNFFSTTSGNTGFLQLGKTTR
jgi:hypothetical protein